MNRRLLIFGSIPFAWTRRSAAQSTPAPRCVCPTLEERDGVIILEGSGMRLSEGFTLKRGRYRIEMEFSWDDRPGHVAIELHTPDFYDLVFNDAPEEAFASTITRVDEAGECFLQVDAGSVAWRVGISPL